MKLTAKLIVISIALLNVLWIVGCNSSERLKVSFVVLEASADMNITKENR